MNQKSQNLNIHNFASLPRNHGKQMKPYTAQKLKKELRNGYQNAQGSDYIIA